MLAAIVKDFDEAVLGQLAEKAAALRDLKRSTRERFAMEPAESYTADQAGAAQRWIETLMDVDRAFSAYRLHESLSYCDCCTDPELIRRLLTESRDDLSEDDIASVAASLLYTIGGVDDLKYFVPRFCRDLLVEPLYDIDSVFARFLRAGFDEWSGPERFAVRNCLSAAWKSALLFGARGNLSELIDPWLRILDSMASLGFIGDALSIWNSEHGDAADSRLLELLGRLDVSSSSVIGVYGAGGFSVNDKAFDTLEDWLQSPAVHARILSVWESARANSRLADSIDNVLETLAARALARSLSSRDQSNIL